LRLDDFDFELPSELIAQESLSARDDSRLLHLDGHGDTEHRLFRELPEQLSPGDVLVVNDTKVFPARLIGTRETGGAAELLLVRERSDARWEVLAKPAKKLRPGTKVLFGDGRLVGEIESQDPVIVRFSHEESFGALVEDLGRTPLPPYIRSSESEQRLRRRYQTIYAETSGSIAAPTAGLHFTDEIFSRLRERGIAVLRITLHVGTATFTPIRSEDVSEHRMGCERYSVSSETAAALRKARRVVAVGTTTVRALESAARHDFSPGWHETDLFITPGFEFKVVGGLITNFHLPKSTLLLLVSALGGTGAVRHAYEEAVRQRYRFYSFGDAMLLYPALHGARGI